jgi:UDP-N-acetylmuramoyl-tripeptide--D-alanyl-D-alanine ligase
MAKLYINDIARITSGKIYNTRKPLIFKHYHFDTRLMRKSNSLFFALKSDQKNGHDYLKKLLGKKGSAAVVAENSKPNIKKLPFIAVEEPLKAAHQLAIHIRSKYKKIKYIGVTGSAGKTTTKEFIYQILSHQYKVFRSIKNWNNWIGLPFSLLELNGDEQFAVFELAMSYPGIGEIDCLAEILKPDVAIVLNVFPVHLEFLKTLDNVARGKSEILNHLAADSTAFVTGDSNFILKYGRKKPGRKIYFGTRPKMNDIVLKQVRREKDLTVMVIDFFGIKTEFVTNMINQTHIENLFAAIVVCQHLGLKNFEIQHALKNIKPISKRGEITMYKDFTIIDETYNSNPEALKKTLQWVDKEYKNRKVAVVGDMLELGKRETGFHTEVGKFFAGLDFDQLITVGSRSLKIAQAAAAAGFNMKKIKSFELSQEAGQYLKKSAHPNSIILFKASRGIELEKAIEEFCNE